jgi:hypothetical protein
MRDAPDTSAPVSDENLIAPVRILDAHGQVLRVLTAAEFRRRHPKVAVTTEWPGPSRCQRHVVERTDDSMPSSLMNR